MDLYSKKSDFQSSSLNERCGQPRVQRKEVHSRVTAFSESIGHSVNPTQQKNNRRCSYQLPEYFCEEASAAADQYQADGGMRQPRIPNPLARPLRCFGQEANSLSHQHQRKPWTSRCFHLQQASSLKDSDEVKNKRGYLLQQNKPIRPAKPRCSGNLYLQANAYGYSYNHQPAKQGLETPTRSRQQNQVLTMEWNSKDAILPAVPHSSTIQTCWIQDSVAVRRCGRQEVGEKKHLYLAKRKEIFHATEERRKQRIFLRVLAKRF